MRNKLTVLCLLFGLQFSFAQNPYANQNFDLTGSSIGSKLRSEHCFIAQVSPDNAYEKQIFQKADSGMVAYLKNYKATHTDYKDAWLSTYYIEGGGVRFSAIEKYLNIIPVDDITLSGTWNKGLDTLYIWGISGGYWERFDTLRGIYRPFAFPIFKYAECMAPTDYAKLLDVLIGKVKSEFGIVTDTVNDVDIARVVMKKDSVVLPQASVSVFAKRLMDSWMEQSSDAYRDYYLTDKLYRDDGHTIGSKLDTIPIEDIKNIDSLVAAAAAEAYVPDRILATEEWSFYTSPTILGLPQINYQYGFIAVRKKVSLGVVPRTGIKNAAFVGYDEFKQHINYQNKDGFDSFEQSIEALFYKKYNVLNIYDEW